MKTYKYTVAFYYATDCRTSVDVEAANEVNALAIAITQEKIELWVDKRPFTIEISSRE